MNGKCKLQKQSKILTNLLESEWPNGLQRCAACGTDGHGFEPPPMLVGYMICKYVDQKGLAAILISIQSADVTLEVNLRITTGEKAHKHGIQLGCKTKTDVTRSPKQGYYWPYKKDLCFPKNSDEFNELVC